MQRNPTRIMDVMISSVLAPMYVCLCLCAYIHAHVCMYACMYVCMYVCVALLLISSAVIIRGWLLVGLARPSQKVANHGALCCM